MTNRIVEWRGLMVEVEETREPAVEPWNGDEPLDPSSEGWDLAVEVTLNLNEAVFVAHDAIGGNWILPNGEGYAYLDSQIEVILAEALDSLGKEIERVASGEDVRKEEKRRDAAAALSAWNSLDAMGQPA